MGTGHTRLVRRTWRGGTAQKGERCEILWRVNRA